MRAAFQAYIPTLQSEQSISSRETGIVRVFDQSFARHSHRICLLQKTSRWKWFGRNTPTKGTGQNTNRNPSVGKDTRHPEKNNQIRSIWALHHIMFSLKNFPIVTNILPRGKERKIVVAVYSLLSEIGIFWLLDLERRLIYQILFMKKCYLSLN
mgnify:CR=1 FL=1